MLNIIKKYKDWVSSNILHGLIFFHIWPFACYRENWNFILKGRYAGHGARTTDPIGLKQIIDLGERCQTRCLGQCTLEKHIYYQVIIA